MFSLLASEWIFFERLCEKQNVPDVLAAEVLFVTFKSASLYLADLLFSFL